LLLLIAPACGAEAVNIAAYLKNRLPHKHLPSSTTPFERFNHKRPTISYSKLLGSKCMYISERKSVPLEENIYHVLARRSLLTIPLLLRCIEFSP
jgi:hypothetical protein